VSAAASSLPRLAISALPRAQAGLVVPIKRLGLTVDYPELDGLKRLVGASSALEILMRGVFSGPTRHCRKVS